MKKAKEAACELLYRPTDPAYAEQIRLYQGCPTVAVTRGGRLYLGWYSGGTTEPHIDNYNYLIYSDDGGKTFSDALLVIPSSRERCVHALDIQLWIDPNGALHVFWVQNNARPAPAEMPTYAAGLPAVIRDGYLFDDFTHACWETVCDDPDADEPRFSEPRYLGIGFLRCKPLALTNGAWLYFNYDQIDSRYGYSITRDKGKTFERCYGANKIDTPFDESMAYQCLDGSIRMLARTRSTGELAESTSYDGALTWTEAKDSGIPSPNTRFFISRTPTGRLLLITNDDRTSRRNMTVQLSEDDGKSWCYKACVDTRDKISYPDADFHDGKIYMTYDRERTGAREILLVSFTEEDVINGTVPTPTVISKSSYTRENVQE